MLKGEKKKRNMSIFFCLQSVNAVTPGCKSSDEILVKNAQNLLQTVLRGVRAAETACIKVNPTPQAQVATLDYKYMIQWHLFIMPYELLP